MLNRGEYCLRPNRTVESDDISTVILKPFIQPGREDLRASAVRCLTLIVDCDLRENDQVAKLTTALIGLVYLREIVKRFENEAIHAAF